MVADTASLAERIRDEPKGTENIPRYRLVLASPVDSGQIDSDQRFGFPELPINSLGQEFLQRYRAGISARLRPSGRSWASRP